MNAFALCAVAALLPTIRSDGGGGGGGDDRLPGDTEPVSYELRLRPSVDTATGDYTYRGRVNITVRARRYTTAVTLHAGRLVTVSAVSDVLNVRVNRSIRVVGYEHDGLAERLVLTLDWWLLPGRLYRFAVDFEGELRDDLTGFHKYFYDVGNQSRWLALTRFKPIYARRAFPCYDEPSFKTPYKISIARQTHHFSLSNMPLDRTEIDSQTGWIWDHFQNTKPIPTYLVAFMVSDFDRKTWQNGDNIAMYARKEIIDNTEYMSQIAPKLLGNVEEFTRVPYMLPKLDLVGVPLLDAYSMENWGLNSHKEFYLTLSSNSDPEDEMSGTMTVLHKFLHQWFGNMVTTPWWDYVWLNEGMCNYLNYYIMNTIEPDWGLHEKFVEDVHQRAMTWDEYDDTHPLTFPVSTADEIVNVFDVITYDKSAALFRMLMYTVGEDNFRASLNKYINDFAYAKAGPKELWETFDYVLYDVDYEIEIDVMVNNSMYLWTEQSGYPLVTIASGDDGSVIVTQKRFMLPDPRKTDDTKWFVGLTYTTESEKNFDNVTPTVWLKPTEDRTTISLAANSSGWIIFNLQSTGFYRVNYDEKNWKLLLIQLITKPDAIHYLNRAQIIDDANHLAKATLLPYDYYISLLEYLLVEDHVTPWNTAVEGLSSIGNAIRRYPAEHSAFQEYSKNLAAILYGKLSANQIENKSTKIGWSKLMTWSCQTGYNQCQEMALRHFKSWTDGHRIPAEMEEAAFCEGMKTGDRTTWMRMYELYETTQSARHRQIALKALACIEHVPTLFDYLNRMQLSNVQNFKTVCESFVTTTHGFKALASYMLHTLNSIEKTDDGRRFASTAYAVLASKSATDDEITTMNKIKRFVKSADLRALFDKNDQKMKWNLMWMERDHEKIMKAIGK